MTEQLEPLAGGYPVVAIVTMAGEHATCGWAVISSDETGSEILDSGVGTTGKALNGALAELALIHAQQRQSLIRTWRPQLDAAVIAVGGEGYLDVPTNILVDDPTYLRALTLTEELAAERAAKREASGAGRAAMKPVTIAVDGSRSRDGAGAWAWITEDGAYDSGAGRYACILAAELTAILQALRANRRGSRPLHILCDSRDAIRNAQRVLAGERPASTVSNSVARVLSAIAREHAGANVTIEWVKGHAGHPLNDRADRLAVLARRTADEHQSAGVQLVAANIADMVAA